MTEPSSAPSGFRVTVLGPFEVWRDDRPLGAASWQRSVQTLLKLLVTSRERRRLRDDVIDTLWPDASPEGGSNNLRYVLQVLRRNLGGGEPSPIRADRAWITLDPRHAWDIDLARFEELAARAAHDGVDMDELASLYRAEPLIEDRYEDWAAPLRAHMQQTWLQTCIRCAEVLRARGEVQAALAWLERALEADPLDEEALRQMLQTLIELGRRSEAMKRFQQFEIRLRSELGIEPAPETCALLSQAREWREVTVTPAMPPSHLETEPSVMIPSQMVAPGAYLGTLPTFPLVARRNELSRLMAAVEAALKGQGNLVLLAGEPGIGKTRLAQEVTGALYERGFLVGTGRCYEPERVVPYYPFLDVLADISRRVPKGLREEIPRRWPYLVRLLPELQPASAAQAPASSELPRGVSVAVGGALGMDQDEPLIIRAVAGFLGAVADNGPLAILLDDLHWSDSATIKLLLHLARHSAGQQLFLLGTYRDLDVPLDHPMRGALIDLGRERLVEKIALERLDSAGTEALIAEALDGASLPRGLVDIVHAPADGNPYFVGEIVRSMLEEGNLFRQDGAWERREQSEIRIPDTVRSLLGQRLSRLAKDTRAVLEAASVLGQAFPFEEVERVSRLSEGEVEAALDEATRAGLVRETRPDVYAFSHALAQAAVLAEMTGRRRRRLHLVAAEAIEAGADAERRAAEIASHFMQAGETARAISHSIRAGDAARDMFAHAEAERTYRSAVEASREVGDAAREAVALDRLAFALLRQARYSEAQEYAQEAAHIFRHLGDLGGELTATCRLAEILQAQGKQREGVAILRALTDSLTTSSPSPGLAHAYMRLSELAMDFGDFRQQEEAAAKAIEIAETLRDRRLIRRAELYRYGALWFMGRHEGVYIALQEYVRILEEDGDLVPLFQLTVPLSVMALWRGELEASREYGERALELARRIGDPIALPSAESTLASSLFLLGDWKGARARLERAITMARPIDTANYLPGMLSTLGHLTVCEGDWDAGEALLREALILIEEGDTRGSNYLPQQYLANLDLLRGQPQSAIERLTPLLDRLGYEDFFATPYLPILAQAYLQLGDIDRAEALVRDALRRVQRVENRLDVIAALLVQADLLEQRRRGEEAHAVLQDVLRHAREMSFPAAEAEALFRLGSLEIHLGNVEAARPHVVQARQLWENLGAHRDMARADEALAKPPAGTPVRD